MNKQDFPHGRTVFLPSHGNQYKDWQLAFIETVEMVDRLSNLQRARELLKSVDVAPTSKYRFFLYSDDGEVHSEWQCVGKFSKTVWCTIPLLTRQIDMLIGCAGLKDEPPVSQEVPSSPGDLPTDAVTDAIKVLEMCGNHFAYYASLYPALERSDFEAKCANAALKSAAGLRIWNNRQASEQPKDDAKTIGGTYALTNFSFQGSHAARVETLEFVRLITEKAPFSALALAHTIKMDGHGLSDWVGLLDRSVHYEISIRRMPEAPVKAEDGPTEAMIGIEGGLRIDATTSSPIEVTAAMLDAGEAELETALTIDDDGEVSGFDDVRRLAADIYRAMTCAKDSKP